MHDVTHLPPITEQRDFLIPQCRAHKMGNPALLFRAHLMRTIDAVHPEHAGGRSEEHTSEIQSLMRISYVVFCLKQKQLHPKTEAAHGYTPVTTPLLDFRPLLGQPHIT